MDQWGPHELALAKAKSKGLGPQAAWRPPPQMSLEGHMALETTAIPSRQRSWRPTLMPHTS